MSRFPSGPPSHGPPAHRNKLSAVPPPPAKQVEMPPPMRAILDSELIERTRNDVIYVSLALADIYLAQIGVLDGQEQSHGSGVAAATERSTVLDRANQCWKVLAKEYWGVGAEPLLRLTGAPSVARVRGILGELVQILLVEGALLFGRAEFETMDKVRKLIETCVRMRDELEPLETA